MNSTKFASIRFKELLNKYTIPNVQNYFFKKIENSFPSLRIQSSETLVFFSKTDHPKEHTV